MWRRSARGSKEGLDRGYHVLTRLELSMALKAFRVGAQESDSAFTTAGRETLEYLAKKLSKVLKKPMVKKELLEQEMQGKEVPYSL